MALSALASFCLMWVIFYQLTLLSGALGFLVCWYIGFLVLTWVSTAQVIERQVATDRVVGDVRAFAEPDEGCGLPPHAATSRARPSMAIVTAIVRPAGGQDRRPVNAARSPTEPARLSGAGGAGIGRSQH